MYYERGSVWRKWDLHIHCPTTALNNQFEGADDKEKWENCLDELEEVEDVSVLGITDYFSIDGYLKALEFQNKGRLSNFDLIVPNCELRITPVTSAERAINFHFIFNPEIIDELDTLFFSNLQFEYDGEPYNCMGDDLIRLGKSYTNNSELNENTAYKEGINQFKVTHQQISKVLKNSERLRKNCLTGVSNNSQDGNSGVQHSSLAATREEIYRLSNFIFSSNPNDVDYFLGENSDDKEEVKRKYGSLKPCIHGSDAHSLDGICNPDLDRYTWIKADPTFEGLNQILFEPETRVQIGKNPPPPPPKSIDKLWINIENDLYVKSTDNDKREDFCLDGEIELKFSPNLNCLIGGRGAGKSTLLNLMRLKIVDEKSSIYPESEVINSEGDAIELQKLVEMDGTTSQEVEFLSQNEIEQFALNTQKFTNAIYERLKQIGDRNSLIERSIEMSDLLTKIEKAIKQQNIKLRQMQKLKKKEKAYNNKRKEIKILEDQKYRDLQEKVNEYSKELTQLKGDRNRLKAILHDISEVIQKYETDSNIKNEDKNQFVNLVEEGITTLRNFHTENIEKAKEKSTREVVLEEELANAETELEEYLSELGYEEQNISNISKAQSQANQLNHEIEKIEKEIRNIEEKVSSVNFDHSSKKEFEELLKGRISELNEVLKKISKGTDEVEEISLEYDYNSKRAFENFCKSFNKNELPSFDSGSSLSEKDVINLFRKIFENGSLELKENEEMMEILKYSRNEKKTNKVIFEYFSNNTNDKLKLLKLYCLLNKINIEKYLKINVTYDGRNIENSSFGQRCTAAIVILLSLGSNPIVIDEPEAHLDSGLIAKYLVELIKDRKRHRQIIFATHNANFVINGDSELIHILNMNEQNKTEITPTTIENKKHRQALYNLEGGEDAFKQREKKYNFQ